jgi:hypothetical protein
MLYTPDRTTAPLIKDAIEFNLFLNPCKKLELNNGAPVYYINDGAEEVALVEFVFFAGKCVVDK